MPIYGVMWHRLAHAHFASALRVRNAIPFKKEDNVIRKALAALWYDTAFQTFKGPNVVCCCCVTV